MITLLILFLAAAVIWVFGTVPWLVINYILCARPEPSVACPFPDTFWQQAGQVIAADIMVMICAGLAIAQLRKLQRAQRARQ